MDFPFCLPPVAFLIFATAYVGITRSELPCCGSEGLWPQPRP